MGSITNFLYGWSRTLARTASKVRDVETILTGDPVKIGERFIKKEVYRQTGKAARRISRKLK